MLEVTFRVQCKTDSEEEENEASETLVGTENDQGEG